MKNIIDQTFLKPNAERKEFEDFCSEAIDYKFGCIALLPSFVKFGSECLKGSGVNILSAVSYPRGSVDVELKRLEILNSLSNGAAEIDMVINLAALKEGNIKIIEEEIQMLRETAADNIVKVILETTLLTNDEIIKLCRISSGIGVDFVKTSTGYHGNKASLETVKLMRRNVSGKTKIKAAGGINTLREFVDMLNAGAERIGTSKGAEIIREFYSSGKSISQLMEAAK